MDTNSDASSNFDPVKFQTLEVHKKYCVRGYSNPIKTQFGTSYILKVSEENSQETFDLWSTKSLSKYLDEEMPDKEFFLTVKINKQNKKYPHFREQNFTIFKS